jgi:hypothetical protein
VPPVPNELVRAEAAEDGGRLRRSETRSFHDSNIGIGFLRKRTLARPLPLLTANSTVRGT